MLYEEDVIYQLRVGWIKPSAKTGPFSQVGICIHELSFSFMKANVWIKGSRDSVVGSDFAPSIASKDFFLEVPYC
jgi:hypothetical protein